MRQKINYLLQYEMHKKARSQSYKIVGETRNFENRLQKQYFEITVNDPKTNQLKYEPIDIANIFSDYCNGLYTQSQTSNQNEV